MVAANRSRIDNNQTAKSLTENGIIFALSHVLVNCSANIGRRQFRR